MCLVIEIEAQLLRYGFLKIYRKFEGPKKHRIYIKNYIKYQKEIVHYNI